LKTIKLVSRSGLHFFYKLVCPGFLIAFREGRNAFKVDEDSEVTSCREVLAADICEYYVGSTSGEIVKKRVGLVLLQTYGVRCKKEFVSRRYKDANWAFAACKFLNAIEKKHGFPLTKVYRANNPTLNKDNVRAFIFDCSSKWLRANQLISLFALIVRLGAAHKTIKKCNDFSTSKALVKLSEELSEESESTYRDDYEDFKTIAPSIHLLLSNYDKIFGQQSADRNFSEFDSDDGIVDFVTTRRDGYYRVNRVAGAWLDILEKNSS
jgi:hypothetical protein